MPALQEMLADEEPNNRARALWVLDRIDGEARKLVVDQLNSDDSAMRALAVRILRRHGDQYAEAILSKANDPSDEVRREFLLAAPALRGKAVDEAIARIAATYDGSDRYQLEAIHIAAAGRENEVLALVEAEAPLPAQQFPLLQLLAPNGPSTACWRNFPATRSTRPRPNRCWPAP